MSFDHTGFTVVPFGIAAGRKVMIVCLNVGQLLSGSVLPIGISTFASGKYIAAQRREIGYSTATKPRAVRVCPFQ